jgi:hypothetical protein
MREHIREQFEALKVPAEEKGRRRISLCRICENKACSIEA